MEIVEIGEVLVSGGETWDWGTQDFDKMKVVMEDAARVLISSGQNSFFGINGNPPFIASVYVSYTAARTTLYYDYARYELDDFDADSEADEHAEVLIDYYDTGGQWDIVTPGGPPGS